MTALQSRLGGLSVSEPRPGLQQPMRLAGPVLSGAETDAYAAIPSHIPTQNGASMLALPPTAV